MADANTTTYNLVKPEVGASEDTWGGKINDNFDDLDDLLDGTTVVTGIKMDDTLSIVDNADNTKVAQFQVSGVTTATTRTFTFPDASGTFMLTSAIGDTVQGYDAGLASISGLTTAADKMIYTTDADTYAVADLTSAGRALLDDADAAAQRTTLGLGGLATKASAAVPETQSYTSGATWTKPANLKYVEVEVWGGGGGSGPSSGNGGTSSFGAHAVATGGQGSLGSGYAGEGGVGTTGDLLLKGEGGGMADGSSFGGSSGSAPRGGGGQPHSQTTPLAGNVPGGGAGGAGIGSNATSGAGGGYAFARIVAADLGSTETVTVGAGGTAGTGGATGGAGMVIVTEYYSEA